MCREALAFQFVFRCTLDLNGMGPSSSSGLSFVSAIWTCQHYISLKKPGSAYYHAAANGQQLPKLSLGEAHPWRFQFCDYADIKIDYSKSHCLGHRAYRIEEVAYRTLWDESTYRYTPNVHTHLSIFTPLCLRWMYICSWAVQICRSLLCISGAIAICKLFWPHKEMHLGHCKQLRCVVCL